MSKHNQLKILKVKAVDLGPDDDEEELLHEDGASAAASLPDSYGFIKGYFSAAWRVKTSLDETDQQGELPGLGTISQLQDSRLKDESQSANTRGGGQELSPTRKTRTQLIKVLLRMR